MFSISSAAKRSIEGAGEDLRHLIRLHGRDHKRWQQPQNAGVASADRQDQAPGASIDQAQEWAAPPISSSALRLARARYSPCSS